MKIQPPKLAQPVIDLSEFMQNEIISPNVLVNKLRTTKNEVCLVLGLCETSLTKQELIESNHVQMALCEFLNILTAALPFSFNYVTAFAWFRSEPIVGFGGRFPEQILRDGEYDALHLHIQRFLDGGYA